MVERVTITINPAILKKIDRMVKDKQARSRSHAIESLLSKSFNGISTALILCGGTAKIDGGNVQKPLIQVHGKPVLEHQINMLKKHGITEIIVSGGEKTKDCFGDSCLGMNISYAVEKKLSGTAGALFLSKKILNSTFAVLNVDTLMEPDIAEMAEAHRNSGSTATMLLVTADKTDRSGVAVMKGNHIVDFSEKPLKSSSKLVNAGFYIFEPDIFRLAKTKGTIEKSIFPELARENKLSGFLHDRKIFDVGTQEGYEKAAKEWKDISS